MSLFFSKRRFWSRSKLMVRKEKAPKNIRLGKWTPEKKYTPIMELQPVKNLTMKMVIIEKIRSMIPSDVCQMDNRKILLHTSLRFRY